MLEKQKLIDKASPKSMADWENSGITSFSDFFAPGDLVTDDVYDNFLNILPPATMSKNLLQVGEPANHVEDPQTGKYRPTYMTFTRVDGQWRYAGECFARETVDRSRR